MGNSFGKYVTAQSRSSKKRKEKQTRRRCKEPPRRERSRSGRTFYHFQATLVIVEKPSPLPMRPTVDKSVCRVRPY